LKAGNALDYAQGINKHIDVINPPSDVEEILEAPKGPGHLVRRTYVEGGAVPSLFAIYQDATGNARATAHSYAKGIGAPRAGV
ncbi:ketol-acid reductoisomerase, partial [Listeria monocytogenes]